MVDARRLGVAVLAAAGVVGLIAAALAVLGRAGALVSDVRAVAAVALAAALAAGEALLQRGDDDGEVELVDRVLAQVSAAGLFAVTVAALGARSPWSLVASAAGGVFAVAGVVSRLAAVRALGHAFRTSRTCSSPVLVASGIYAFVRHPSETGLLAFAFGTALLLGSPLALVLALAVLLPASCVRARREDRALASAFGRHHFDHAAGVGALVPNWASVRARPGRAGVGAPR